MKALELSRLDLTAKVKAARTDIADVASLKAMSLPKDGEAFMVVRTLYIWTAGDTTPDDGRTVISLNTSIPGRFRIPKMRFPLQPQ